MAISVDVFIFRKHYRNIHHYCLEVMEKEASSKIWVMGTSRQAAKLGWDMAWLPYRVYNLCPKQGHE